MKYIFVDCGAFTGDSIEIFRENYPNSSSFDIYAFECNPKLYNNLLLDETINPINRAVWINNDEIEMYLGGHEESSTLIKSKRTGKLDKDNPITVRGVDLSQWIESNFNENDFIVVKMNIEGAEYEVIEKLCSSGVIKYIDMMLVQWHVNKIGISKKRHNHIHKMLLDSGVSFAPWDINRMDDMKSILKGDSNEILNFNKAD